MKRFLLALLLSVGVTVVFVVRAGMAGGMCHCMTAMFAIDPTEAAVVNAMLAAQTMNGADGIRVLVCLAIASSRR